MEVLVNGNNHINHFNFSGYMRKEIARMKESYVVYENVRERFVRALDLFHSYLPYSLMKLE
jgi:hypothetical protein